MVFETTTVAQTEEIGAKLAAAVCGGTVVAMFGGLGMGKTAFVRGMAKTLCPAAEVSSPTFALVQDYGGCPSLVHFDMYRIETWDDLYATGFFEYIDQGAVLAVEWSEQIEGALPEDAVRVTFERVSDTSRRITVEGVIW